MKAASAGRTSISLRRASAPSLRTLLSSDRLSLEFLGVGKFSCDLTCTPKAFDHLSVAPRVLASSHDAVRESKGNGQRLITKPATPSVKSLAAFEKTVKGLQPQPDCPRKPFSAHQLRVICNAHL